jgi:hypothetical protein
VKKTILSLNARAHTILTPRIKQLNYDLIDLSYIVGDSMDLELQYDIILEIGLHLTTVMVVKIDLFYFEGREASYKDKKKRLIFHIS